MADGQIELVNGHMVPCTYEIHQGRYIKGKVSDLPWSTDAGASFKALYTDTGDQIRLKGAKLDLKTKEVGGARTFEADLDGELLG